MNQDLTIEDVKRIRLKPGDVLVLRLADVDEATVGYLTAELRDVFPENRVLVLDPDATFEVYEATA